MENLFDYKPFELDKEERKKQVYPVYRELTQYHYDHCESYKRILDSHATGGLLRPQDNLEKFPYIPVRLFKEYELYSVPKEEITRTVVSSGTTGQVSSKIFLDRKTAAYQQKALAKIVGDFIGTKRMPMLIVDCADVVKDRTKFSTRGAGILGFSVFGTKREYALHNDMTLDHEAIERVLALSKEAGIGSFLFGFTFIIWKHFLLELEKSNKKYDFSNAVMIHGGGWKKLISEAVTKEEFKERFEKCCGLKRIHENYGMAEQTGSIFVECECGHLHASIFSDIIMRDALTMQPCKIGEKGIMQVMSVLPHSYPGHSLLTEDEGIILGEDDCPCGRKGKYFEIIGRLAKAELRGCSDTYAAGISK